MIEATRLADCTNHIAANKIEICYPKIESYPKETNISYLKLDHERLTEGGRDRWRKECMRVERQRGDMDERR